MKLERSRNAIRNVSFGLVAKIGAIFFPFLSRTVFIHTLGEAYLGLNSLFASVLTVLNLAELGFGSAIVFCMYRPVAEDDHETINALLHYYRRIYRYIGLVILGIGLLLVPFLPYLVNGSCPPDINLTVVYLVFLGNTVMSYFLFGYRMALITAFQREDLISKVDFFISGIICGLQITILLTVRNYYVYLLVLPLSTIINNIRTLLISRWKFSQYSPQSGLSAKQKEIIKEKVSGLMISKVSAASRNSLDSIFIAMFMGLVATAKYTNYCYVMHSIVAALRVLTDAVTGGVGNSVVLESAEKNYHYMQRMNFLYMWLTGWCTICLLCMYQPFMEIWAGKKGMLPMSVVSLICVYFYFLKMGDVRNIYEQAKGIWWENRFRAIAETVGNLFLNFWLGRWFGVHGIIAATLVVLFFIDFCYGSRNIYRHYFKTEKISEYYSSHIFYGLATVAAGVVTYIICEMLEGGITGLIARMVVCVVVPNILYWLIYRRTEIYEETMPWLFGKMFRLAKEMKANL